MNNNNLPKGYHSFTSSSSKERIQFKTTIKGVRRTLSCKYDPRKNPIESYEEVRQWKESILHPEVKSVITVPSFAKHHITLSMTLKEALLEYIDHYANTDHNYGSKSRRMIRPSDETIRVAKENAKLVGRHPLGKTKLYDLDEGIIQDFFYDLADKYTFKRKGIVYHYSKNTSDKVYALIKNFLYEMGWEGILFRNVKKAIHNSDIDTLHLRDEKPENQYLSDDELRSFLHTLKTTDHRGRGISIEITDAILVMYDLADAVIDRFGEDTRLLPADDTHFTFTASIDVSPPFYAWIATFGRSIKILEPMEVVEGMKDFLQRSSDMYKD